MHVHLDVLAGFVAFGVVAAATPGPNNLMLMTSGVKFGFARTLPHLAGVVLGFSLMVALVGLGLDAVFQRVPQLLPVMRILGSLYMLWLAMKIAFAGPIGEVEGGGKPARLPSCCGVSVGQSQGLGGDLGRARGLPRL